MSDRLNAALEGRYRIERELGQGGMATVYLAEDVKHQRKVAVKVLRPELAAGLGTDRFLTEIRVTANLQHPHILPLFDSGEADSFVFYVMPYITGESLREKLDRERQLGIDESLSIARAVAAALHYAHRNHVIHRDIKPANVLLSDGLPVVADFGIARALEAAGEDRITRTGLSIGTPAYMSPEQSAGELDVDARSDVYSLGCMLYEMVTGETPYTGPTARAIIAKSFTDPIPSARRLRESLPDHVDSAIWKALGKAPSDRFATAAEFASALAGGSSAPVQVREALAIAPANRTPFVGRTDERAELLAALDDAVAGNGSLILLGGEPGVGKTRLAEEILLEAQRRELLCFIGHAYEGEGAAPYAPFVETLEYAVRAVPEDQFRQALGDAAPEVARMMPQLRRIYPDIPPPIELPPEQQRRHLFNSYREFVERATSISPLVCLLDDLHWADEPSLLLLQHLAQHLPTQRMLIIGTYRDVELDVKLPFAGTLATLNRQRLARRIALRRFPESAVRDLLAALGGGQPPARLVSVIFRETEGNPFFVEEVFRHLDEEGKLFDAQRHWLSDLDVDQLEVPEGVRLVIGRRLERVGDDVQKVLAAGAVVGRRFNLRVMEALELLADDALFDALEEAETAQLIHASAQGRETVYRFSHELIRHTLAGTLSIPKRQRLHLRIAQAMERVYPSQLEERAADYSFHLYQAGAAIEESKAIHFLTVAATQALAAAAFEEALVHLDRALSIDEGTDRRQHAELLFNRAAALHGLGRWDEASQHWEEVLPLYENLGDVDRVVSICEDWGQIHGWRSEYGKALDVYQRGLRMAGTEPSAGRGRMLSLIGFVEAITHDPENWERHIQEAIRTGEVLGDQRLVGLAEHTCQMALYHQGRFRDAIEIGRTGEQTLRSTRDHWLLVQLLGHLQIACFYCGRGEDVEGMSPELRRLSEDVGNVGAQYMDWLAILYNDWARTADADRTVASGLHSAELWRPVWPWSLWGSMTAAWALFCQGDWDRAVETAEANLREYPENQWTGGIYAVTFVMKAYVTPDDALSVFEKRKSHLREPGQAVVAGERFLATVAPEGLARLGEREAAAQLYPLALEAVELGGIQSQFGLGQRYLGISAACGRQWDAAQRHFETALRQAHDFPFRSEQPETRRWYAWMLLDRDQPGDREKAERLLEEAIDLYRTLGMPKHVAMAEGMRT